MSPTSYGNKIENGSSLNSVNDVQNFRSRFHIPKTSDNREAIYLAGNSLGLQPKTTRKYIEEELEDWASLGVEGHHLARHPWLPYHEFVTEPMARVVGALPTETVVMNSYNRQVPPENVYEDDNFYERDEFNRDRYSKRRL